VEFCDDTVNKIVCKNREQPCRRVTVERQLDVGPSPAESRAHGGRLEVRIAVERGQN
jgi:hypothetical protein